MTRPKLHAYVQLTFPFLVAVSCAVWIILQRQPMPELQGVLPLLILVTGFTTLVSVNLDSSWARTTLTGMNLAALFFFYLTTVRPALFLEWL